MPNTAILFKFFKPKNKKEKRKISRSIQKLFNDDIIYLSGERIVLTKRGQEILKQVQVDDVLIPSANNSEWDGVWHLVGYDIPEDFKKARDCFRRKLIESGFEKIQLSLWVYPYNCKEEIAIISQNLGIAPFVAYLNTDYLPQQDKLIKSFSLTTKHK
jgi:DNA-binding transcriptional regulator PaaX